MVTFRLSISILVKRAGRKPECSSRKLRVPLEPEPTKMATRQYSTYFSCLYDENDPVGRLGRGTHYSIMRSVEWLDVCRKPLTLPHVHDFAVIWDEDHDDRVIDAIERIYMAGLLSPIQFIGERKGTLSALVASRYRYTVPEAEYQAYVGQIQKICHSVHGDHWPVEVGMFDRAPGWPPHQTETVGLIADDEHRVVTYLRNVDNLWKLGTRAFTAENRAPWAIPPVPVVAK